MPSFIPLRGLRMEDDLYLKLTAIAKNEDRSFNKQAISILRKFVEDYEKNNGEIKVNADDLYQ